MPQSKAQLDALITLVIISLGCSLISLGYSLHAVFRMKGQASHVCSRPHATEDELHKRQSEAKDKYREETVALVAEGVKRAQERT